MPSRGAPQRPQASAPARSMAACDIGSHDERRAAPAGALHVRVLQIEARRHEPVFIIEHGAVQIEKALPVDDELGAAMLEDLVALAHLVQIHLVGEAGAAAPHHLHPEARVGLALVRRELPDLGCGLIGHLDHDAFFTPSRLRFQSASAALMPSSASTEQWIFTGGSDSSETMCVFLIAITSSIDLPFTSSVT